MRACATAYSTSPTNIPPELELLRLQATVWLTGTTRDERLALKAELDSLSTSPREDTKVTRHQFHSIADDLQRSHNIVNRTRVAALVGSSHHRPVKHIVPFVPYTRWSLRPEPISVRRAVPCVSLLVPHHVHGNSPGPSAVLIFQDLSYSWTAPGSPDDASSRAASTTPSLLMFELSPMMLKCNMAVDKLTVNSCDVHRAFSVARERATTPLQPQVISHVRASSDITSTSHLSFASTRVSPPRKRARCESWAFSTLRAIDTTLE